MAGADDAGVAAPVGWQRIALWLALAAVPSGLMLSTTTHLTTDIFAMPLLWVIPLGVYLLSFSVAFAENRLLAQIITRAAPFVVLFSGGMAMLSQSSGGIGLMVASVMLLFVVAVALHARMYDLRPDSSRLTLFYLVMSAGGALGGLFTALIAPLVFDWVWEHPLLVFAAAALIPLGGLMAWQDRLVADQKRRLMLLTAGIVLAFVLGWYLFIATAATDGSKFWAVAAFFALALLALLLKFNRLAFVVVFGLMMVGVGAPGHGSAYAKGERLRSYFGVYTVTDLPTHGYRQITHGTTLHGRQYLSAQRRREPTTYYGRNAGVGLVLANAATVYGPGATVGIVGLGAGTLACYRAPDQTYRFYEIDPAILDFSTRGQFSYLSDCAPDSETIIGDARIELERGPAAQYDVLVVDAFSSDAIPLHLLTREALQAYRRTITENGAVLIHISNRFIELEPVLAALARDAGMSAAIRYDQPDASTDLTASKWVVLSPSAQSLGEIRQATGADKWTALQKPAGSVWSDEYASTLPHFRWNTLFGQDN